MNSLFLNPLTFLTSQSSSFFGTKNTFLANELGPYGCVHLKGGNLRFGSDENKDDTMEDKTENESII